MDKWEQDRIDRLEDRIAKLEQKNWDRSMFWLNVMSYVMVTAAVVFATVAITLNVSSS